MDRTESQPAPINESVLLITAASCSGCPFLGRGGKYTKGSAYRKREIACRTKLEKNSELVNAANTAISGQFSSSDSHLSADQQRRAKSFAPVDSTVSFLNENTGFFSESG
jgi:hypothetical protein